MNRGKGYLRRERAKHIKRRKSLVEQLCYHQAPTFDGMLSKGKIHCSCPLCTTKSKNKGKRRYMKKNYAPNYNWKHSDKIKIDKMNQDLKDFIDFL